MKTRVRIPQLVDQQANFEANATAPNKLIVFYKSQVKLYLPLNRSGLPQWTVHGFFCHVYSSVFVAVQALFSTFHFHFEE